MVKHLKFLYKCIIIATGMLWVASVGAADAMVDPTRPPAMIGTAAIDGVAADGDVVPVLQSVMISRKHKRATISGQEYKLGDLVGEAKLVAVRDHEVDLRNPDGSLQTLQMYSGVTKTVIETKRKPPSKAAGTK